MKPRVLAIDDVPEILDLVRQSLSNEGFEVQTSTSMTDYRTRFDQDSFDVYLIDVSLPDGNGFALVQELRQRTTSGIILLTGRASETDHVVGLEIGADDYITKPFRLRELAARVRAVHRRTAEALAARPRPMDAPAPPESPAFDHEFDGYRLSVTARVLLDQDGTEIELTTAEFELLAALLRSRGRVLSRDQLMNEIKGREWESYDRVIDGLVSRVRRKVPRRSGQGHYIRTVHGVGYCFGG